MFFKMPSYLSRLFIFLATSLVLIFIFKNYLTESDIDELTAQVTSINDLPIDDSSLNKTNPINTLSKNTTPSNTTQSKIATLDSPDEKTDNENLQIKNFQNKKNIQPFDESDNFKDINKTEEIELTSLNLQSNPQSDEFQILNSNSQILNTKAINDSPPVLTINGKKNEIVFLGEEYVDLGVTAFDEEDGELNVMILGEVNTHIEGEYQLVYFAIDSNEQRVEVIREVSVVPNKFITIWQTNNEGASQNNQITLEVNKNHTYDFTVHWGDGEVDTHISENITHTYELPGEYKIMISGLYPGLYFSSSKTSDAKKLLSVEHWGSNPWKTMYRAFYGCENMVLNATDAPDLSSVENMNKMFANAHNFNQSINHWDVSNVKSMSNMFFIASQFNQDISNWDVSNVESMESMFRFAGKFNQDISAWNVSKVKDMNGMFLQADQFNQNINNWNISAVKRLDYMFAGTDQFNQDLSDWNLESVENLSGMFSGAKEFNQNLNQWDVSNVKNLSGMFQSAQNFNGKISDWQLREDADLSSMFRGAKSFNTDISFWNVSKITSFKSMFKDAISFDQDLSLWEISNVQDMSFMFEGAALSTQNYDALLIAWANQIPQEGVVFDAGSSQYTKDSLSQTARNTLVDTFGWVISDGGVR